METGFQFKYIRKYLIFIEISTIFKERHLYNGHSRKFLKKAMIGAPPKRYK